MGLWGFGAWSIFDSFLRLLRMSLGSERSSQTRGAGAWLQDFGIWASVYFWMALGPELSLSVFGGFCGSGF